MEQRTDTARRWGRIMLLAAITALAATLRLSRIESLPPADGYDAAYYGVDALQLLRGETPQVMYPPNREPLFSYLVAGAFLLFGPSTAAIHLTSALIGILTIPLVHVAADALFNEEEDLLQQWGGPVAALVMAISYWHLNWSRLGVRAILVPLFAAATIAFLWRGLSTGNLGHFILCGISLGLSMYTYQAARLLPALVVISFAASAWKHGAITTRDWQGLAMVVVVSLLVFAPLGIHFTTHPGSFSRRIEEAMVVETGEATLHNLQAVVDQARETWLAFSFVGDTTPYSTVPGRPSLNPFLSALFFLGIGISLLEIRRPSRALLVSWLILMTIPASLAGKGPTAKRAIGTLPAVAMLIAVGAIRPWFYVRRRLAGRPEERTRWLRAAGIVILLGGFAYTGIRTYRGYFIVWASNPDLPSHFEAHISSIGEYIGDLPDEQTVYLSPELPRHPSIRFHSELREDIRGYNGRVCFATPIQTQSETTYVIVPSKEASSLDLLTTYFPEGKMVQHSLSRGHTPFVSYHISAGARPGVEPLYPLRATWDNSIQLLGYDLGQDAYRAGETILVTLSYLDLEPMAKRYTVFVHLIGPVNPTTGQPLWGQNDSEPCHGFYPTTSWHEEEILIDRIEVPIQDDTPPGTYRLGTGFYDVWTGQRLPVESDVACSESGVLILGEVTIQAGD